MADEQTSAHRWTGRPWAARSIRALVYLVPFTASVVVAVLLGRVVPPGSSWPWTVLRFVGIAVVSTLALIGVDRITRRLLPLAALLDLTLLFPDQAPSRYKVAIRSASATQLQKLLDDYTATGADEPARAAERLLELVGALRDHDRLTRGHSERVRAYSQMIGEEMGLSGIELDRLRWAGLVHDIGKLRIDPAILNKPGRLTDEEFETIKLHPAFGAELAAPLAGWLGESVLAVSQHHERWDGGGYPAGLSRTQISLAARIVSVADTFDVMTSVRSYKAARPAVEAREELAKCAGTQFDPAVVRAFLSLSLGKLRVAMGPLSWVTQLAMVPKSIAVTAAAPAANAVAAVTGVAAAAVGAVATTDQRPTTPVRNDESAVVVTTTTVPGVIGEPVVFEGGVAGPDLGPLGTDDTTTTGPGRDEIVEGTTTTTVDDRPIGPTTTVAGRSTTTTSPRSSTTIAPATGGVATTTTTTTFRPGSTTTTVRPTSSTAVAAPAATTTIIPPTTITPTTTIATTTTTAPPRLTGTWLLGSSAAGNVASQEVLPLAARSALNGSLPNFDTDRNAQAGLTIRRGGSLSLGDATRLQRFRMEPGNVRLDGTASVRLYAAPAGLLLDSMRVAVALVECSGAALNSCSVISSASSNFTGLLTLYQAIDVSLGAVSEHISSTHSLEVWVVADSSSSRDLLLAYDTTGYVSTLTIT